MSQRQIRGDSYIYEGDVFTVNDLKGLMEFWYDELETLDKCGQECGITGSHFRNVMIGLANPGHKTMTGLGFEKETVYGISGSAWRSHIRSDNGGGRRNVKTPRPYLPKRKKK